MRKILMKNRQLERGDIVAVPRAGFINFGVVSHSGTGRLYYWDSLRSYEKGKFRYIVGHAMESSNYILKINLKTIPYPIIRTELSEILVLLNI